MAKTSKTRGFDNLEDPESYFGAGLAGARTNQTAKVA
jgi:hypothetical protein